MIPPRTWNEHRAYVRAIRHIVDVLQAIHLSPSEKQVLENAMRHPFGIIDDSVRRETGMVFGTPGAARNSLVSKDLMIDSGRTAPTGNGGTAKIWMLDVPRDFRHLLR